jgi:hypothetical protein
LAFLEHTVIEIGVMVDIEQKAKELVLESCLVASSIGCARRGAIIFVHQKAGCSLRLSLPHTGHIFIMRNSLPYQELVQVSQTTEIITWAS